MKFLFLTMALTTGTFAAENFRLTCDLTAKTFAPTSTHVETESLDFEEGGTILRLNSVYGIYGDAMVVAYEDETHLKLSLYKREPGVYLAGVRSDTTEATVKYSPDISSETIFSCRVSKLGGER